MDARRPGRPAELDHAASAVGWPASLAEISVTSFSRVFRISEEVSQSL